MILYRKEMDQKLALFEKQRLEFGSRKLAATIDPHQQSEALLRNQGLLSYKFEQSAQFKKDYWQNPIFKQILKVKNLKGLKRQKLNQNIYEQSFKNCLTEDKEVDDGSQQSDIDWQTDINLFENTQNSFVDKKDLDVQQIFEYLQQQLLKEILGDPFPIRGQLQNSQVKNESNLSSQYSQSFEEESLTASKEVVQEPKQPPPLAVKPILNKEKVMILVWVNLPSIEMNNLRNFYLSENSEFPQQSENKEEGKEVMLVIDFIIFDFSSYYLMKLKKIEIKRCNKFCKINS